MNLAQLELRRLRELLRGAKRARHLVHAMRTPLARFVRFERAALQAFNRPLTKLERVASSGFEAYEPSEHRELVAHLSQLAESLAKDEAKIAAKVERLSRAKRLSKAAPPIEERIAKRRKVAAASRAEVAQLTAKRRAWERELRERVRAMIAAGPSAPARAALEHIEATGVNDPLDRSALRHAGYPEMADALLSMAQKQVEEMAALNKVRRR